MCYSGCSRPAYCGAYPLINDRPPGSSSRLIVLSKTALANTAACERRGAWQVVHAVPPDEQAEAMQSGRPNIGLLVHDLLGEILLAQDPSANAESALDGLSPDEAETVRPMIMNHLSIDQEHHGRMAYQRKELQLGVTYVVEGSNPESADADVQVVVVLIARVDATGREADGTPAVVEHKTTDTVVPFERDLYAVAAWRRLAMTVAPDEVAIHHHYLQRLEGPRCERRVYDAAAIAEASDRVRSAVTRVAAWNPVDALSAPPLDEIASICRYCPFRSRCSQLVARQVSRPTSEASHPAHM